jgi:CRP/FNR family transcriptional regulator, cyclic AMP receptor protein
MPVDPAALEESEFFGLLGAEDRRALSEVVDLISLEDNQTLFRAGEPGESLYLVRAGEVELFINDNVGQKIVLDTAVPGDFFGEIALLDAGPRTATAVALTRSELIELDRDDLLLLFTKKPDAALRMLAAMGRMTRKADALLRTRVSRNVNEEVEERLTLFQRVADWLAWFSGSVAFLLIHAVWFGIWIVLNVGLLRVPGLSGFDPFPFGLLTMIVSLEAIFLATFVLISQNRQVEKDKVRNDIEYEVNVTAEKEVKYLHEKTDHIHEEMLRRFNQLEKLLARRADPERLNGSEEAVNTETQRHG